MDGTAVRGISAILATFLLLVGVMSPSEVEAESVTIRITHRLEPASVTVAPSASITFENADGERHRMRTTSGPDDFDTGNLESGQRSIVTLTAVGTYRYLDERDDENAAYVGEIVVSSSPPTTTPGEPPASPPPTPTAVTVSIGDRLYAPATFTVAPGGTVTWVNNDDRPHTVTADDRSFDSGIMNAGDTWSRVFPQGGTFTYFCELHPDMRGGVVVDTGGGAPPSVPPPTTTPAPSPPPTTSLPPPSSAPPPTTTTPGTPAPTTASVSISGNRFTPATITIVAGGSVTWANHDAVPHTVTEIDGSADSGILRQGERWSRRFPDVGTFPYFCELHPEMTATVVVVPPGTPAPPTTTPVTTRPTPAAPPPTSPPSPTSPPPPPSTTALPSIPSPGQPLAATATVTIADSAYQPQVVTIAVGGSVTWTNLDQLPHTVTADDRSFDSGILFTGGTWTMSFATAGTYTYFCELHPEMTGTVVVTTPGAAPPPVVTGGSSVGGSAAGTTASNANAGSSGSNSTAAGTASSTTAGGTTTGSAGATDVTLTSNGVAATPPTASPPGLVDVTMSANQFQPVAVTVGEGGTVTWTNTDALPHTVTADDGSFDSGIMMPGDTFSWRFDRSGVVPYRCILHPGMNGTVEVVAGDAAGGTGEPLSPTPATGSIDGAVAGASPALDAGPHATASPGDDVIVRITEGEFPGVVTLAIGQTVTWVNDDDRPIDIVADDGSFASGEIAPGERYSLTLSEAGARSYRSTLRDRMEGMIVVVPGSAEDVEVVPTVAVYDAWFTPRDLVVHQGATVRWAFGGALPHTVTAADGSFDSGILEPGAVFTRTFDEIGSFDYSCVVHPSMTGTVTVVASGEDIPASRSGISAVDAGRDTTTAAAAAESGGLDPAVAGAPPGLGGVEWGAVPLLILGLGFGAALGILFGVGRSPARDAGAGST